MQQERKELALKEAADKLRKQVADSLGILSKKPYHRFSGTLPKSGFGFAELQTSKFLPRSKTNNG